MVCSLLAGTGVKPGIQIVSLNSAFSDLNDNDRAQSIVMNYPPRAG